MEDTTFLSFIEFIVIHFATNGLIFRKRCNYNGNSSRCARHLNVAANKPKTSNRKISQSKKNWQTLFYNNKRAHLTFYLFLNSIRSVTFFYSSFVYSFCTRMCVCVCACELTNATSRIRQLFHTKYK